MLGTSEASAWLDAPLARIECNRDVQVVGFLATQMYLAALAAEGIDAAASLGLSLGEYSHLVHIGALTFADALTLVSERGRRFDEAPCGRMVTVLAVDHESVAEVVARAGRLGTIVISNINAPTQHVSAGSSEAVTWAAATLEEEFAAHTTVIEERVPMHSPLMTAPARSFTPALESAPWRDTRLAYRPNVTAAVISRPQRDDFIHMLTRHVHEPVQWQASLDLVSTEYPGATFVEVGPGSILHNMLARSWRSLTRARVDDPDSNDPRASFQTTLDSLQTTA